MLRKPPSEKLYLNTSNLSVVGVQLHRPRRLRAHHHHQQQRILLDDSPVSSASVAAPPRPSVVLGEDVVSRQVRKIRETVQVEDFERLLIGLGGGRGVATETAYADVYHDFFEVFYDLLKARMAIT